MDLKSQRFSRPCAKAKKPNQKKAFWTQLALLAFSIHFNRIPRKTQMWVEVSAQSTICHRKEQMMDSLNKNWNESVLNSSHKWTKALHAGDTIIHAYRT
jgi:hypothetical protein